MTRSCRHARRAGRRECRGRRCRNSLAGLRLKVEESRRRDRARLSRRWRRGRRSLRRSRLRLRRRLRAVHRARFLRIGRGDLIRRPLRRHSLWMYDSRLAVPACRPAGRRWCRAADRRRLNSRRDIGTSLGTLRRFRWRDRQRVRRRRAGTSICIERRVDHGDGRVRTDRSIDPRLSPRFFSRLRFVAAHLERPLQERIGRAGDRPRRGITFARRFSFNAGQFLRFIAFMQHSVSMSRSAFRTSLILFALLSSRGVCGGLRRLIWR